MKFFSTYFKDVKLEMKKVAWLSKDEMVGSTIVVLVFAIIVAVFLFFVDFAMAEFVSRIIGRS